ncbi:MAG: type II toxin-antitoxin system RelE/ParE family toxin [Bacteroidetes bacterium]|nr:MAG: type II toxin-antitoxin system RelE/ParE family toxin [Bacteroidota bacterium]
MKYGVKWSPEAKEEFSQILDYLESRFGNRATIDFIEKVDIVIGHIAVNPKIFPASPKRPDIHRAIISKQTSLYYRLEKQEVQLLHFWDNRKDPDALRVDE